MWSPAAASRGLTLTAKYQLCVEINSYARDEKQAAIENIYKIVFPVNTCIERGDGWGQV